MASAGRTGESAVGARGLTGHAYHGHVFWDADVFVLPFLAATDPPAARSMLEYRIRRLPQAREAARAERRAGARFPWESAATGADVTPTQRSRPERPGRADPQWARRGPHRRRRRVGGGLLCGMERRRSIRTRSGARAARRNRALLAIARPRRSRRPRASLRRDRARRVSRTRRRQRLYQRARALEPAHRGHLGGRRRCRRRAGAGRVAGARRRVDRRARSGNPSLRAVLRLLRSRAVAHRRRRAAPPHHGRSPARARAGAAARRW